MGCNQELFLGGQVKKIKGIKNAWGFTVLITVK